MSVPVAERIKRLIVDDLDFPTPFDFDAATPLFEGGIGLDSFAAVELIALIEAHFHIELALSDIVPEHFADVNAVARLVERYLTR